MQTTQLKVEGMNCVSCVTAVEQALEAVPKVKSVEVNLDGAMATVEHDGANEAELVRAVADEGYQASVASR